MRVQALEGAAARPASDAGVDLGTQPALLVVRGAQARCERGILRGRLRPALHPTRGLEARDGGDEERAGQPERGGKGIAGGVVRALLGDGGPAERAAHRDCAECARLAADLAGDDGAVYVSGHGQQG